MKLFEKDLMSICVVIVLLFSCTSVFGEYIPWDELYGDNWIQFLGGDVPHMYPVNAADDADVAASYPISFVQAADGDKARGMNSLRFVKGGVTDGHFVSRDRSGSIVIGNTGDSNVYTDILLLVAIDADSLVSDFSMTLNLAGHVPYVMDANDFVYYNSEFGRPSGFYSVTDPNVEPISYAFDKGMVTVYGVSGVTALNPVTDKDTPYPFDTITVEYSFSDVSAPVVFSVYGYAGGDPEPTIYHTNRGSIDVNNKKKLVSTFAVTVEGDLNGDLKVDIADLAMMSENWLVGVE